MYNFSYDRNEVDSVGRLQTDFKCIPIFKHGTLLNSFHQNAFPEKKMNGLKIQQDKIGQKGPCCFLRPGCKLFHESEVGHI